MPKISQYAEADLPLSGDELIVVAQNGRTKKVPVSEVGSPGGGAGTPGGSDGQIQYNNAGALGGLAGVAAFGGSFKLASGYFLWSEDSFGALDVPLIGLDTDDTIRIGSTLAGGFAGFDVDIDVGASQAIRLKAQELAICANNVQIGRYTGGTVDCGGGLGVVGLDDAATEPSTNPTDGVIIWSYGGVLKYRDPNGNVTIIHCPIGVCVPEMFGAKGDGVTDDSAAFEAARVAMAAGTYRTLVLGARTYLYDNPADPVTEANAWPFGCSVVGQGAGASIIMITTNNEVMVFRSTNAANRQKSTLNRNYRILGNNAGINQWGLCNGFSGGDGSGAGFVVEGVVVENCAVGIFMAYGPTNGDGGKVSNSLTKGCTYGAYAIWQSNWSNCQMTACGTGALLATGNVTLAHCDITGSTTKTIHITSGGNDGHGLIQACNLNHNPGAPIYVEAVANGFTFVGNDVFETPVEVLANTGRIKWIGGILAPTTISLNVASKVRFSDVSIGTDYFVSYSDGGAPNVEWKDCEPLVGDTLPSWVPLRQVGDVIATADASPAYRTLHTFAVGDVKQIDLLVVIRKSDASVRQSFRLSALVYGAAGPTATLDATGGGALTDAAPRGTGSAVAELNLNGADCRLKITGIAATDLITTYVPSVVGQ